MTWHPIETAPEDEQVLVYMPCIEAIDLAHLNPESKRWTSSGGTTWPPNVITKWMPLPLPPEDA